VTAEGAFEDEARDDVMRGRGVRERETPSVNGEQSG
jgi:hypothetical protein